MNRRILQIIPAEPGWHVVYEAGALDPNTPGIEESQGVAFVPVACWALVEDGSGRAEVIPLSAGGSSLALVLNDPKHPQALGVSPPGRRPVDWVDRLPKPEPKPAPKPEPKPAPKAEPKPAPKPEPAPKAEPKPAPKPEPKPEPAPEIKMDELLTPEPPANAGGIPGGDVFDF